VSGRYHQLALLERALLERGLSTEGINVDHRAGIGWLADGSEVGLVYPDSFFEQTSFKSSKPINFLFCGLITPDRRRMLDGFQRSHGDIQIIHSKWGRVAENKGRFDADYFGLLARSRFGLCPHQPGDGFEPGTLWTYRFAECCIAGTIPVCFRETPLSSQFTDGFRFVWDDNGRLHEALPPYTFCPACATANRDLAERRFCLPEKLRATTND
jgi:hypothetical protein